MDAESLGPFSRVLDLTQPLSAGMAHWPGDPLTELVPWADAASGGYRLGRLTVGEHSGTHLGAPAHFVAAGATVDQLPAELLVRPACMVDFRRQSGANPDAALSVEDLVSWERRHGQLRRKSVVLLCTGWAARWGDPAAYLNADAGGQMHFPGFSEEAVRFLVGQRRVAGLGSDAAGIDPGKDGTLAAGRLLLVGGCFHVENLVNLEQLPATGAWIVVGALRLVGGSGAPARVLALLP